MTRFYCDELSERCVLALRDAGVRRVVVLDKPDAAGGALALREHIAFEEAQFFAGHLRDEHGEAVYFVARRMAGRTALTAAKQILAGSALLTRIAARFEGQTIRLAIAKLIAMEIETKLVRALVCRALSGGEDAVVWMRAPLAVPIDALRDVVPGVRVHFYFAPVSRSGLIVKSLLVELARDLRGLGSSSRAIPDPGPAVLLTREDDLGMDRSYRCQPHWVEPTQPVGFPVYVRGRGSPLTETVAAELAAAGIHCLTHGDAAVALRRHRANPALRTLAADARACLLAAMGTRDPVLLRVLLHIRLLLLRARELGAQALHLGVRAFVSGEPYLVESDAMQLAAPALNVETITFQYSNLAFLSPLMLTTSDRMALFSETYRSIWDADGIHPRRWEYLGYSMDGAAQQVRKRATVLRARLKASGAHFVLCYFDESVQHDRWGCLHADDHRAELAALASLLLEDASVALIVKSQFERNSPSRLYAGDALFERARATGRYVELCVGTHRNVVFPAEAALSADLCIGHLIGATASLEAALAGVRSVLLNPTGLRTEWDPIYARADIVYASMQSLLEAIGSARRGEPSHQGLGDWSNIVQEFDAFRDGRSAQRLRELIERCVRAPLGAQPS